MCLVIFDFMLVIVFENLQTYLDLPSPTFSCFRFVVTFYQVRPLASFSHFVSLCDILIIYNKLSDFLLLFQIFQLLLCYSDL